MLKILHIADVHLGIPFRNRTEAQREKMRMLQLQSLQNAVAFALSSACDLLLIAGDLFEKSEISLSMQKKVEDLFRGAQEKGLHIVYVTGNHDFSVKLKHTTTSGGELLQREGKTASGETYVVYGIGHESSGISKDLSMNLPKKNDGAYDYTVGLLHASVESEYALRYSQDGKKRKYAPTTLSRLEELGYDYLGLGHIHVRKMLTSRIGYSGSMVPTDKSEDGGRGGILVTLDADTVKTEFVDFSLFRYEALRLDATDCESTYDTFDFVVEAIRKASASSIYLSVEAVTKHPLDAAEVLGSLEGSESLGCELSIKQKKILQTEQDEFIKKVLRKIEEADVSPEKKEKLRDEAIRRLVGDD